MEKLHYLAVLVYLFACVRRSTAAAFNVPSLESFIFPLDDDALPFRQPDLSRKFGVVEIR